MNLGHLQVSYSSRDRDRTVPGSAQTHPDNYEVLSYGRAAGEDPCANVERLSSLLVARMSPGHLRVGDSYRNRDSMVLGSAQTYADYYEDLSDRCMADENLHANPEALEHLRVARMEQFHYPVDLAQGAGMPRHTTAVPSNLTWGGYYHPAPQELQLQPYPQYTRTEFPQGAPLTAPGFYVDRHGRIADSEMVVINQPPPPQSPHHSDFYDADVGSSSASYSPNLQAVPGWVAPAEETPPRSQWQQQPQPPYHYTARSPSTP